MVNHRFDILPIMSFAAYDTDTRFGKAQDFHKRIEELCGKKIVHTLADAEPLGPKIALEALIISPCTGTTLAKIAHGIYDTPVTLAAKAHLRSERPLVIALATNDALSGNGENLMQVYNRKNVYFVPMHQDDPIKKPFSLVSDFGLVEEALEKALVGQQLRPLFL